MRNLIIVLILALSSLSTYSQTYTYTLDGDFDQGTLTNLNHDAPNNDQLQLSEENIILPFLWVPNYDGTVSKVNTETGDELGRYRVAPHSSCNPSRTTVDLNGNCWVGNRAAGTVVKIGLLEAGQYIDRNGNGTIETSRDLNNDGNITGGEILPWGQDECVLYEVVLIPGKIGTFVPGTYAGGYDYNYWGTAPRGLAIDANNNLWAGTWNSSKYFYVNGTTGAILSTLDVSPWGHSAYGAVIDGNGILWSATLRNHVLRIDPSVNPPNIQKINLNHTYGLGLDYLGHLFVGGYNYLTKIDVNNTTTPIVWTKRAKTVRGVVCTSDNNVWVAGYDNSNLYRGVSRYDNNGNPIVTIGGFNSPSGVAVDAAGKLWVTDINSANIYRIDPATNSVDLTKTIIGSGGHYTYSDMTGIVARTITTKIGTWNVVYDSGVNNLPWGTISWNSDEPTGTTVSVKVRSSNDQTSWSPWESSSNGTPLSTTPDGRYLEVEVTMQILSGDESPILYDLTIQSAVQFVDIDIKPQSCPNPFNVTKKGVIPVAILGTAEFDVQSVDPASILFEGISPLRWALEDVTTPLSNAEECECSTEGPDGFEDLTLKFASQELATALGGVNDGDEMILTITGNLMDGVPIEGSDCVIIIAKKLKKEIADKWNEVPTEYALYNNYPNPFNPSTTIRYSIPVDGNLILTIYDVLGNKVNELVKGYKTAGNYAITFNAENLTSGIYFYTIKSNNFMDAKRMLLVK